MCSYYVEFMMLISMFGCFIFSFYFPICTCFAVVYCWLPPFYVLNCIVPCNIIIRVNMTLYLCCPAPNARRVQ